MIYVIGKHVCRRCGAKYMSAWSVPDEGVNFECSSCEAIEAELVGPAFDARLMPDVFANLAIADTLTRLRFPPRPKVES